MPETIKLFFNALLNPLDIGEQSKRELRTSVARQMLEVRRSRNEARKILAEINQDLSRSAFLVTMNHLTAAVNHVEKAEK